MQFAPISYYNIYTVRLRLLYAFAERPAERAKPVRREEPRIEPGKFEGLGTHAGSQCTSVFV